MQKLTLFYLLTVSYILCSASSSYLSFSFTFQLSALHCFLCYIAAFFPLFLLSSASSPSLSFHFLCPLLPPLSSIADWKSHIVKMWYIIKDLRKDIWSSKWWPHVFDITDHCVFSLNLLSVAFLHSPSHFLITSAHPRLISSAFLCAPCYSSSLPFTHF